MEITIPTLEQSYASENERHQLTMVRIQRFYQFWNTGIDNEKHLTKYWKINDNYYLLISIDVMNYTMHIIRTDHVSTIFLDFRDDNWLKHTFK